MLTDDILKIENFCKKNNINIRFVGGASFGGLLNKNTEWEIEINKNKIYLKNYNILTNTRNDNSLRDIDCILLEKNINKTRNLNSYLKNQNIQNVVIESAVYFPEKINPITQFVTSIYVNENDQPFLVFGNTYQEISQESLNPWTIILDKNISYSVRNPIADYFAYQFRSPAGVKQKDKEKIILLKKLALSLIKNGKKNNINYMSNKYFGAWEEFIKKILNTKDLQINIKKHFMNIYWNSIGEYLSHGRGLSKYLIFLQNKFTGSNQ